MMVYRQQLDGIGRDIMPKKGYKQTELHRKNTSISMKGKRHDSPIKDMTYEQKYGVDKAKEIKTKQSRSRKYIKFSEQWCENISKAKKGLNKNKTYSEMYGIEKAQEIRKKQSKALKNKHYKDKTYEERYGIETAKKLIKKLSEAKKGKNQTESAKIKTRQKAVERVLLNNGKFPSYSKEQVEYFKNYDIKNNTNGQYATNPHEYYIKELGYWPDYIDFNNNLIMEYDEKHHSKPKNKSKDVIRQKEIQQLYPDFKFIRIGDNNHV